MSYAGFNMMAVVDDKAMQQSLNDLAFLQKKDVNEITRQWAGTLGRYLASWTKPIPGSLKLDKKSERKAVEGIEKGINWVYTDIAVAFKRMKGKRALLANGKSFKASPPIRRLIAEGRHEDAEKILHNIPGFESYNLMMFDRGNKHRWFRGVKAKKQYNVIVDSENLRKYMDKKRRLAGFTKAAWINAARQITGKTPTGVNKWVWKHTNSPGRGSFNIQGPIGKATLSSTLPWASDTLSEANAFREFSGNFKQAMDKAIDYHLKKEQRKK